MKIFTRKNMLIAPILLSIVILTIDSVIHNYFYDEEKLVADYYQLFFNQHKASVPEKYQCSRQNIINNKQYTIKDRDYVTFFCDNGKVVVYRFEKGLGRSVMLSVWKPN